MASPEDEHFARAAALLTARREEVVAKVLEHLARELPPEYGPASPERWELVVSGAHESIRLEYEHLAREELPSREAVAYDLEGARTAARLGVAIEWNLFLYRAGHRGHLNGWIAVVEELGFEPVIRRAVLDRGSTFFFAYADRLGLYVAEAFAEEREALVGSREQRRARAVAQILEGGDADPETLGHPLDGRHVAVLAAGPDARRGLDRAAAEVGRSLLTVAQPADAWWAWLSGPRPLADATILAVVRRVLGPGASAGVGHDQAGTEGFRRTYEEARAAYGSAAGDGIVGFADVALVSLAGADPAAARRFVASELHGLDGEDARSRRLRETLVAWFASAQNAAATAARLGVHEQTVAGRLRAVEERIGRPPAARRAELETALRLRERFAAEAGRPQR